MRLRPGRYSAQSASSGWRPPGIVGQHVVGDVDDVPAAVFLLRDEVRVLDDAAERHRRVPDVQPVVRGQRAVELEDRTEHRDSTRSRSTPSSRPPGGPAPTFRSSGRDRGEDEVERLRPARERDVESTRGLPHDLHGTGGPEVAAARRHAREDGPDAAPNEPSGTRAAPRGPSCHANACGARSSPEPDEADVLGPAPVLLDEEGTPHGVQRAAVAVAAHPAHRGLAFQALPVRALSQLQRREDELEAARDSERREREERRGRAEVEEPPSQKKPIRDLSHRMSPPRPNSSAKET